MSRSPTPLFFLWVVAGLVYTKNSNEHVSVYNFAIPFARGGDNADGSATAASQCAHNFNDVLQ